MIDAPSIDELCHHARCACVMAGLTPMEWRWNHAAWRNAPYFMLLGAKTDLPAGCLGIYDGLPVYAMRYTDRKKIAAVACIGSRKKPAF